MGIYAEQILPRLTDVMCGAEGMDRYRRRAAEGLSGRIVEIGFGSGLNLPVYPDEVTAVLAVEPSEVARRRSAERRAASAATIEDVGLDGQSIDLPDDSCDGGFSSFTLCTIPDPGAALRELRRVIRPGGRLHFLEHGIAPDEGIRTWQRRIEPVQRRLAGGCHLTRDAVELVRDAGFEIDHVDRRYVKGPKPWSFFFIGQAHRPT